MPFTYVYSFYYTYGGMNAPSHHHSIALVALILEPLLPFSPSHPSPYPSFPFRRSFVTFLRGGRFLGRFWISALCLFRGLACFLR